MSLLPSQMLAGAATVALLLVSQSPAWAAGSVVGLAHYDPVRRAVVVPYSGSFPTFESDALTGPPRVYFDFAADQSFTGVPAANIYHHGSLVKWTMAHKPGGRVRLVLQFNRGTQVLVLNDASRRQILLVPQGVSASVPIASPIRPVYHPPPAFVPPIPATRTFYQTFGTTDFKYTVGPRPRGAVRDQVNVNIGSNGVTDFHVTSDPERNYVNFSISISGKGKGPRVPKATPRPAPKPTLAPVVEPVFTPEPLPTPVATPVPTPVPTPEATPVPTPVPVSLGEPGTILSFSGAFPVSLTESSNKADGSGTPATNVAVGDLASFAGSSQEGFTFETRFANGGANYMIDLNHLRFRATDKQTESKTGHDRDEYEAYTGFGLRFTPLGTEEMIGIGYGARFLSINNVAITGDASLPSAEGTPMAAPAGSNVLSDPMQLYHGPVAFGRLDLPLFGPMGLEVKGGGGYYLLGALSTAAESTQPIIAYWGTPSAYLRFGSLQLNAGFTYTGMSGSNGYAYSRSGPVLRADWRF